MKIDLGFFAFDLTTWVVIGFLGQLCFTSRFLVQWIASEKAKRSVIPTAFWYFSLMGGGTLFLYALHIKDPVFILGQSMGVFIYSRNLYFVHKEKNHNKAAAVATEGSAASEIAVAESIDVSLSEEDNKNDKKD